MGRGNFSGISDDGPDGVQRVTCCEGFRNKVEEPTCRVRQPDAGTEAENAVAGELDDAFAVLKPIVLLATTFKPRSVVLASQQQTQTVCPLTDVFLLPGEGWRPR